MVLRREEEFDRTDLDIPKANERGQIHRDYIAHCMRWSYACRFLNSGDPDWGYERDKWGSAQRFSNCDIMDVGCGEDLMLYRAANSNRYLPKSYTGIDINKLSTPEGFEGSRVQPTLLEETDFLSVKVEDLPTRPNVVTSFEVVEHVPLEYAKKMLKHMYDLSTENAYLLISTPCFCPRRGMAANHINEMLREDFKQYLEDAGWVIKHNYGTFGGRNDLYKHMTCLLYTSPSPRDRTRSRMPSSA